MSFIAEYWNTILVILMKMPMVRPFKPCTVEGQNSHGHTLGFHPDSKFKATLYSIINSTTGKYCSVAFI